jgi:NADH dehydrogenase
MIPRQVTVFGASGFVGRHVVRRLAAAGVRVIAAQRDDERASFLKTMGDVGQVVPVSCNVSDKDRVASVLEGSDAVIDLVGILFETSKQRFADIHGAAPGIIAAAAAEAGIHRLVHVSAIAADATSPSAYARTKAEGEDTARAALPQTVILRPSIVFGPEDGFFNRFAGLARFTPFLPLFGGGKNSFQPVYVGDVADAVMTCLIRGDVAGRTFELGGPRRYTFRELMELITAETGRRRVLVPLPLACADIIGLAGDIIARLGVTPLLTRDQAELLRIDNVVADNASNFADLAIVPCTAEAVLPSYLCRYCRQGRPA